MTRLSPPHTQRARQLPVLAIVGRPNVGKSTLFNKLIGERKAIVVDLPGVTRDRNYGEAEWAGKKFRVIDTGGFDVRGEGSLEESVQKQRQLALAEADVILFLLDGKGGLNPVDREAIDLLRRIDKPVFFAVNKIDSKRREENLYEFYGLGLDRLFPISAEHGLGFDELMDDIVRQFPSEESGGQAAAQQENRPCRIAVVGRPNVGKSTLINRLLGFERSVVDARPGTTRDALDTPFVLSGEPCVLVDTAGIRRKARITDRLEYFSVNRSLRSVDRADLVIYILDGPEGVTDQDAQILSYAHERGKALVLAVNKCDLLDRDREDYRREVYHNLSFLEFVPVVFIAATTGQGVRTMLETAARVLKAYRRKIPTSALNQSLQRIVKAHPAPLTQGRPVKFYYGTQIGTAPPTFMLFVNSPSAVSESYQRYLIHHMRESLGLESTPVRLLLRPRRAEQKDKGFQRHWGSPPRKASSRRTGKT
jgi:GTP-binding protein